MLRFKEKAVVFQAFALLSTSTSCPAAEVFVEISDRVVPQHLTISAGDKVTWLNRHSPPRTNLLKSFKHDWDVPLMAGDSGSKVFTEPGFSVYHTLEYHSTLEPWRTIGTITITDRSSNQPVALAAPVEGLVLREPDVPTPLYFAVAVSLSPVEIDRVEYYAGDRLLGISRASPFHLKITEGLSAGNHEVFARLMTTGGAAITSPSRRVAIKSSNASNVFSYIHALPNGPFLFHLDWPGLRAYILKSKDLVTWTHFESVTYPTSVTLIDEQPGERMFYRVEPGP